MGYQLSLKDYEIIKMLSVTCHATRSQVLKLISRDQLSALENCGIIKKTKAAYHDGKYRTTFRINQKAQSRIKRDLQIRAFYSSNSPVHDVYLTDKYLLLDESERDTIRTEGQGKNDFQNFCKENTVNAEEYKKDYSNGNLSAPDFSYKTSDGTLIYVEISNGYKQKKIDAKFKMVRIMGAKMELIEIKKIK